MPKKIISVEVETSGHGIMQHTAKLMAAWKQAMSDGWQPGQDVPSIVMAVVAEGPGIMADAAEVKGDLAEDKLEFIKGVNLGAYDVAEVFFPKAPAVQA